MVPECHGVCRGTRLTQHGVFPFVQLGLRQPSAQSASRHLLCRFLGASCSMRLTDGHRSIGSADGAEGGAPEGEAHATIVRQRASVLNRCGKHSLRTALRMLLSSSAHDVSTFGERPHSSSMSALFVFGIVA
eukprot:2514905-Prymnesium_polylepis.1